MKRCAKCGENKSLDIFTIHRREKSGRSSYCRLCQKEMQQKSYQKNKKKRLIDAKKYYQSHRAECHERNEKWRKSNKDKVNLSARRVYKKYMENQRSEYNRRHREHYQKKPRIMVKLCTKCGMIFDIAWRNRNKTNLCKICRKENLRAYKKDHKQKNIEHYRELHRLHSRKNSLSLTPAVIRGHLHRQTGIPNNLISNSLINQKREQIQLFRLIKTFKRRLSHGPDREGNRGVKETIESLGYGQNHNRSVACENRGV